LACTVTQVSNCNIYVIFVKKKVDGMDFPGASIRFVKNPDTAFRQDFSDRYGAIILKSGEYD
jgi:hypothetical protein